MIIFYTDAKETVSIRLHSWRFSFYTDATLLGLLTLRFDTPTWELIKISM